jgi:MFS family permease
VTFALGLLSLLAAITFAQVPYGGDSMGWGSPLVRAGIAAGVVLLALFAWIESRVPFPMFNLRLFTIRAFAAGNIASFLFALARGGLQFMLIIWLQGIWLPLHGVRFEDTPLQAGLATLPMMVGFTFFGPLGGWLSDKYGARVLATTGMLIQGLGFFLLTMLPVNFSMPVFAMVLLLTGAGMGLFSAPNTSQIMSSVPPEYRGVAAGMRATMLNAGMMASTAVFFTVVISRLSVTLPPALVHGLEQAGVPASLALQLSHLPAGSALFAALLGYNPFAHLLPPAVLASLGPAASRLLEPHFFAQLIAQPFIQSLRVAFFFSLALCVAGAIASLLRGGRPAPQVQPEPAQARRGPVAVSGDPGRGS